MGELDVLELYLFAQDPIDETVLALHRQALAPYRDVVRAALVVDDPMVRDGGGDRWWQAHDDLRAALKALEEPHE